MQERLDAIEGQLKAVMAIMAMMPEVTLQRIEQAKAYLVEPQGLRALSANPSSAPEANAMTALRKLEALVQMRRSSQPSDQKSSRK